MSPLEKERGKAFEEGPMTKRRQDADRSQAGFALFLAMLCLMVLTFLGMTLATTTSTELQIATNYRWSQQAFYNAEAGIELGKRFLRQFEVRQLVGDPRALAEMGTPPSDWTLARPGPDGEPSRNWENQACDTGPLGSGVGYGNIIDDPSFTFPMQNTSNFLGRQLNGTVTVWIRRATEMDPTQTGLQDMVTDPRVVLTAEGTAPFFGAMQLENRAVRYLTVEVERLDPNECGDYAGQSGSGATGSGYTCESGAVDPAASWGAQASEPDSTVQ